MGTSAVVITRSYCVLGQNNLNVHVYENLSRMLTIDAGDLIATQNVGCSLYDGM